MMRKNFSRTSPGSFRKVGHLTRLKNTIAQGFQNSKLLKWQIEKLNVDHLVLVPQDLRTSDPSLPMELDMGQFGLAGATAFVGANSPFFVPPPTPAWERELHSFTWLRNMRAARTDRAREQSVDLLKSWLSKYHAMDEIAWETQVVARRLMSWLNHSSFFLYNADQDFYQRMVRAIEKKMQYLSSHLHKTEEGAPRLVSLIALVLAGLCIGDQEKFAARYTKLLLEELDRQILPDGGHISRNNAILAGLLLDLLPLKQCFIARDQATPQRLVNAVNRMLPMIHYMRLGDGLLSRFNGAGTTSPDTLGTAMAYDDVATKPLQEAPFSHYYRLKAGNVILLMDGGAPAKLELTSEAHAGCLSFEMSSGTCPVIVNCGAAAPGFAELKMNARATVSHSTLTINNSSSSRLIKNTIKGLNSQSDFLQGPNKVQCQSMADATTHSLVASHDGYLARYGYLHHRRLTLTNDGYVLTGEDRLELLNEPNRTSEGQGLPFAIHFHIHPDVSASRQSDGKAIVLELPDSQKWKLTANEALISLEESTFYADFAGPYHSVQAVIRGQTMGHVTIAWQLEKLISSGK